jgi:hypothetical protein
LRRPKKGTRPKNTKTPPEEDMEKYRKIISKYADRGVTEGELEMKYSEDLEEAREENNDEETTHEMDLEKVELDMQILREVHGEKKLMT